MVRPVMTPFRLGPLMFRNRLVFAPITTQYADEQGRVTERIKAHYEARARGGVGVIVVEATYVEPVGHVFVNQLGIHDDSLVEGLRDLAACIKRHGSVAAIQLHHGGRMARSGLTGIPPVAPSAVPAPGGEVPCEMSLDEIEGTVRSFVRAAERAREAGFGAVELHGAHGYLIDSFISGASNRRTDAYGGSVENRARFLIEIIEGVKAATGPGFPVWVRMNGREYGIEQGTTLGEAIQVAKLAQKAGVDGVHVSAFGPATPTNRTTAVFKPAVIEDLAATMKHNLSVPVIAVGRITASAGDRMIEEANADLVAVGKGLLADADMPRKLTAGKPERIVPCIVCMHCRDTLFRPDIVGIRCQVNPCLGRDHEPEATETTAPKRILVVGGGPAGIVAATVAAARGHDVTLWERSAAIGGQLRCAAMPPHKDRIRAYVKYLENELVRTGVLVELNREATEDSMLELRPDVVILATGPRWTVPDIPGFETSKAVSAEQVLNGTVRVGSRVIIVGGELVGCETAEYLVEQGRKVTVTRRGPDMATGVGPSLRQFFLDRLQEKGVRLLPGIHYVSAHPGGLVVRKIDGRTEVLEADTLVYATGATGDTRLYEELCGRIGQLHRIGDCLEPGLIVDAVRQGYEMGCRI